MSTLLHISASPRGPESESLALADTFLGTFRETHPDHRVTSFDLWDGTLPAFGPDAASAKMAVFAGQEPTGTAAAAWQSARDTFARVAAADDYLFSVPMWNHSIPYVLKQLIDVISQPGLAFDFDPDRGYSGLLTGRKAAVIYTSAVYGDDRSSAFGIDFQTPYFNDWLRWVGIDNVAQIQFRPNLATPDAETARQRAHAAARDSAKIF